MAYEHTLPDGSVIKVVPEADLMAVKTGAERDAGEAKSQLQIAKEQLDAVTKHRDETHSNLLQAQAAKEQLEEQIKEGVATKAQMEELQTKLSANEQVVGSLNTRLLDLKRVNVSTAYGVDVNTLQERTMEQLESLEEALKLVGKPARPATVDIAGGGGGTAVPVTAMEQCKEEIAAIRSKGG